MTIPGRPLFGSEARGGPVSLCIPSDDASRIGEIRRAANALADSAGLGDSDRGRVSLVATEAATNASRHGRKGAVIMRALGPSEGAGIEIIAVDHGPGIANVGRALEDGFSTGGTPGKGLGAVKRVANEFDIFSSERGTVLFARIRASGAEPPAAALDVGVVCLPLPGEHVSGDGWSVDPRADGASICMADGLGHGPAAAAAADAGLAAYRNAGTAPRPAEVVQRAHEALRATRGAAFAVGRLETAARRLRFAGVGNISTSLHHGSVSRSMASVNGTAGLQIRTIQEYDYEWPAGAILVMHTDGLTTRWRLDDYPGLSARPASTIAAVLHRDFTRGRDDATVVVVRERR